MSKIKINDGHYHEAMDRVYIVTENIDDHILKHPICKHNKKIRKQIEKGLDALVTAYQMIGQESHDQSNTD